MRIKKILILVLVFLLVGCSKSIETETESDQVSAAGTTSQETVSETAGTESESESETESEAGTETADTDSEGFLDIKFEKPIKLKIETTYESEGMKNETVNIIDGDNYRLETNAEGMRMIIVYNSETQMSYIINDEDKTVMPMGDMGLDAEMLGLSDSEETNYDSVEEIKAIFGAYQVLDLEGDQVIYVEKTEDGNLMKIWISTKFGYPVKMEIYKENALIMSSKSKLSTDFDSSTDLFNPPSDYKVIDLTESDLN